MVHVTLLCLKLQYYIIVWSLFWQININIDILITDQFIVLRFVYRHIVQQVIILKKYFYPNIDLTAMHSQHILLSAYRTTLASSSHYMMHMWKVWIVAWRRGNTNCALESLHNISVLMTEENHRHCFEEKKLFINFLRIGWWDIVLTLWGSHKYPIFTLTTWRRFKSNIWWTFLM